MNFSIRNIRLFVAAVTLSAIAGTLTVPAYAGKPVQPAFSSANDAVLCYGGSRHRTPFLWDKERLAPFVTYVDPAGEEHWLFDGFIFLEFQNTNRPDGILYTYETGNFRDNGFSAGKAQWQEMIDYYFTPGNGVYALDECVKDAKKRIGKAPEKRKAIIMLPDPVVYKCYIDTLSGSTYWGELDGRQLDFEKNEDRLAACKWYIDQVRAEFAKGKFKNVELAGFYWLREIVPRPQDIHFSYNLTRSDILLPLITDYLHQNGYTLSWIPYFGSRGQDAWRTFGFDHVYLQPNYYWKPQNDMNAVCDEINALGVGMEFEFDEALLNAAEGSDAYRERFREYMEYAKKRGIYAKQPLSYYHGTNGFYDLAVSEDPVDRKFYNEFCQFIIQHPLRNQATKNKK